MGIAMLLLTGCVAGSPSTSNAEVTRSGGAFPATVTPGTGLYTASVAEGTGPESPLSPAPITFLRVPGPTTQGIAPPMTIGRPEQCLTFTHEGLFAGDLTVQEISVTPPDAFESDASLCNGTPCVGASFPEGLGSCQVGIRWIPDSGDGQGAVTVVLAGVCNAREGTYCDQLATEPPPEGTAVRVLVSEAVQAGPDPSSAATTATPTITDGPPTPSTTSSIPASDPASTTG